MPYRWWRYEKHLCASPVVYMVYTWYNVRFKVHISIADVAKDTSFHCFENVRVSTTRICSKRWRYSFKKIIRLEIIASSQTEKAQCVALGAIRLSSEAFYRVFRDISTDYREHTAYRVDFWNNFERNEIHRDFSRGEIRRDKVIGVSSNFSSRDTLIIDTRHSSVKRDVDNKVSRTITLGVSSVREKRERERERRLVLVVVVSFFYFFLFTSFAVRCYGLKS